MINQPKNKHARVIESLHDYDACLHLLLLFILFISSTLLIIRYTQFNTNTAPSNLKDGCLTDSQPYCALSYDHQFTKFLLFGVDGVSWLFINRLRDLLHEHSHEYITYTTNIRYTSELLKTWYSGRDNDKMNARRLSGDTLLSNYVRKYGKKIHIYGSYADFKNVLADFSNIAYNITDISDEQPEDTHHAFGYFFLPENAQNLQTHLDYWSSNNLSLVAYTESTDHIQHHQGGQTGVCYFLSLTLSIYILITSSPLLSVKTSLARRLWQTDWGQTWK